MTDLELTRVLIRGREIILYPKSEGKLPKYEPHKIYLDDFYTHVNMKELYRDSLYDGGMNSYSLKQINYTRLLFQPKMDLKEFQFGSDQLILSSPDRTERPYRDFLEFLKYINIPYTEAILDHLKSGFTTVQLNYRLKRIYGDLRHDFTERKLQGLPDSNSVPLRLLYVLIQMSIEHKTRHEQWEPNSLVHFSYKILDQDPKTQNIPNLASTHSKLVEIGIRNFKQYIESIRLDFNYSENMELQRIQMACLDFIYDSKVPEEMIAKALLIETYFNLDENPKEDWDVPFKRGAKNQCIPWELNYVLESHQRWIVSRSKLYRHQCEEAIQKQKEKDIYSDLQAELEYKKWKTGEQLRILREKTKQMEGSSGGNVAGAVGGFKGVPSYVSRMRPLRYDGDSFTELPNSIGTIDAFNIESIEEYHKIINGYFDLHR